MTLKKPGRRWRIGPAHAPHRTDAPVLEVAQVSVCYENVPAIEEVSFVLNRGDRLALVGPNGAGKSTLFKTIAGVRKPDEGRILVYGREPGRHICIAYVPQRAEVDWSFPLTVRDAVLMGVSGRLGFLRRPSREDREFVEACLEKVGLVDLAERQISELSGGQQQRMFIARALAQDAALMLMDEPMNGVDTATQEDIFELLDRLSGQGMTTIMATHDLNQAAARFQQVMLIKRRIVGFGKPAVALSPRNLQEAYGGQLRIVKTADGSVVMLSDPWCNGCGREGGGDE